MPPRSGNTQTNVFLPFFSLGNCTQGEPHRCGVPGPGGGGEVPLVQPRIQLKRNEPVMNQSEPFVAWVSCMGVNFREPPEKWWTQCAPK